MKKIFLGITAVALTLTLAACGTSGSSAAITSLSNQLDETSNTVSNMQTVNTSDISLAKSLESDGLLASTRNTQQALLNEELYKTDILEKTAELKSSLSKDLKLSKAQISAVKDLTTNLAKYTNSVSYSKSELSNTVKSISSLKKNVAKNSDRISAKLNRLACNSNSRSAYYENILNTLEELENILPEASGTETNETTQTKTKNIDTYAIEPQNAENSETADNADNSETTDDTENQTNCPNCQQYPINNPNYRINGANRYFNRFNPNRNTDTYGPTLRNIDTYGINSYNYGYGNAGYGYENPYNYGGFYGNGGAFGNGGFYGNRFYNSNNFNRMTTPMAPINQPLMGTPANRPILASTDDENDTKNEVENIAPEKRLEDFEEIKDGELTKQIEKVDDLKQKVEESAEDIATTSTNQAEEQKTSENEKTETQQKIKKDNFKGPKIRIVDARKRNFDEDDLNQPIKAHKELFIYEILK